MNSQQFSHDHQYNDDDDNDTDNDHHDWSLFKNKENSL